VSDFAGVFNGNSSLAATFVAISQTATERTYRVTVNKSSNWRLKVTKDFSPTALPACPATKRSGI
jgi:hypothetical protein